jgi:drug/metabolite transporter (DMT)-like permease
MPTPLNETSKGVLIFVAAWLIIPLMDVSAKALGAAGIPVIEVVWARFLFNSLLVLPVLYLRQPGVFKGREAFYRPKKPSWQIIRVVTLISATAFFFTALKSLPLAEALAIYFVYPFIVTALATVMLGEKIGLRRWLAVGVGFLGSMIIVRPGFETLPAGTYYLFAGALSFAIYNIYTRKLTAIAGTGEIMGFQSLFGALIMTAFVPFVWVTPDLWAAGLFMVMGLVSAVGHGLLIRAYHYASASLLAPFSYIEIVSATILGFIFFGNFPDRFTWAGVAVIVSAGIYISLRERRAGQSDGD